MKAPMSDLVKQILKNPSQRQELLKGLNTLHKNSQQVDLNIGNKSYKLKFVNKDSLNE